jgi:hypothetical protein
MKPSEQLIEFLDSNSLPWVWFDRAKGKIIFVVDNHLLGTYRNCPQHFVYANIFGIHRKSQLVEGEQQRVWNLDFGIVLHKMIELYYKNFRSPDFDVEKWAFERGVQEWLGMKMDIHNQEKEYKLIGGMFGFCGLLAQFAHTFSPQNEKIRVIASEVSFGRAGEVPLHIDEDIEIYLAGRMDLIIDDGYFICPMDHKSQGVFRDDPGRNYETEEGPTGYIYTLSKILPKLVPAEMILKRDCNKIYMNLIQKKPETDASNRFKRVPIRKTQWQLQEYRDRQVSTVEGLFHDLERLAHDSSVRRNDKACTNWFHRDCSYRDVCRQNSAEGVYTTLNNGFVKLPIWNTEEVAPTT